VEALEAAGMSGPRVIVMGVSGSGKSTVGMALAQRLGVPFEDGDDLHPAENVAKMHSGHPLTDADRWGWLAKCGDWLADRPAGVLACSALKRTYRDLLRSHASDAVFIDLDGPAALLHQRLEGRHGHFMPTGLLDSQLADYERLGTDEDGIILDIARGSDELVEECAAWLAQKEKRSS
jgi:carbohydrate kinase (thermoresistant glucokinase family)